MTQLQPRFESGSNSVLLRDVSLYVQHTSLYVSVCLAGWTGCSSLTTTALLIVLIGDLLLYVTVTEERARSLLDPADVPWVGFAAQALCQSISSDFLRPDERREAKGSRPTQQDGAVMKSSTWTQNSCPADGMFYMRVQ